MPSTHGSLHVHLVFRTKDRQPLIHPFWKERLHAYLGGVAHQLGAVPEAIGGTEDQVQHHRSVTFQNEYLQFLEKEGVAYNERYLW